jgi:hypothetical protein
MSIRLYRSWKERRRRLLDRYAEMDDEQRDAIDRYRRRPGYGPLGGTIALGILALTDGASVAYSPVRNASTK